MIQLYFTKKKNAKFWRPMNEEVKVYVSKVFRNRTLLSDNELKLLEEIGFVINRATMIQKPTKVLGEYDNLSLHFFSKEKVWKGHWKDKQTGEIKGAIICEKTKDGVLEKLLASIKSIEINYL